jgi:predicted nucleic acid-binding protein
MQEFEVIISDTSCMILLDKIDAFDVLKQLSNAVVTTPEIETEFGDNLPDWIKIRSVQDISLMEALNQTVDPGEASAIALAIEIPGSFVMIDDLKGRKLAKRLGLNFMGVLGMLLKAKEHNIIQKVTPYINSIQQTDFRVTQSLIDYVFEQAGE